MKTTLRLILAIALITLAFPTASAQNAPVLGAFERPVIVTYTLVTNAPPAKVASEQTSILSNVRFGAKYLQQAPTNAVVHFDITQRGGEGPDRIEAIWLAADTRLRLTCYYSGTNVSGLELSDFKREENFTWQQDATSDSKYQFPAGTEKVWIAYAEKLRANYQLLAEGVYAEVRPLTYVGVSEELSDGVVVTTYIFSDADGKYRLIQDRLCIGEAPKAGQRVYLGGVGYEYFLLQQHEGKFLIDPAVLVAAQKKK